MRQNDSNGDLAEILSRKYMAILSARFPKPVRTFGFEYEFLPDRPLGMKDMDPLDRLLHAEGGRPVEDGRLFDCGIRVTFEPGGQIEYCSPPLQAADTASLDLFLGFIRWLNGRIRDRLGIHYLGTGYMPGRGDAPLCLRTTRYLNLHKRLSRSGTRGHEMMKGTAAIHLHAAICSMEELVPLFRRICELSSKEVFRMSEVRRDIWDNTDPVRSGPPPCCFETMDSAGDLVGKWVRYALRAVVLGGEVSFEKGADRSFEAFLYHMTTIFTDIRFNLKGPTLELRTPDSVPVERFNSVWLPFVDSFSTLSP